MNPKSIFNLFSPKGKVQTVVQQGVSTLIMSAVALSLLALIVCAQVVLADEPAASGQPSIEALSTGVKAEVDPDQDIGLMEFFTMPNETTEQRAIERKADEDIGLLEFFKPQAPALASSLMVSSDRPTNACTGYEAGGVLGFEDGLLSLLGISGQKSLVASLLEDGAFSLYSLHRGSANYVMFIKTECLGQLVVGAG
jgi:hypothetical protein